MFYHLYLMSMCYFIFSFVIIHILLNSVIHWQYDWHLDSFLIQVLQLCTLSVEEFSLPRYAITVSNWLTQVPNINLLRKSMQGEFYSQIKVLLTVRRMGQSEEESITLQSENYGTKPTQKTQLSTRMIYYNRLCSTYPRQDYQHAWFIKTDTTQPTKDRIINTNNLHQQTLLNLPLRQDVQQK